MRRRCAAGGGKRGSRDAVRRLWGAATGRHNGNFTFYRADRHEQMGARYGGWQAAWTDRLVSLQVAAPEVTFVAGQFGRLALPAPPGSKEDMLGRPIRS